MLSYVNYILFCGGDDTPYYSFGVAPTECVPILIIERFFGPTNVCQRILYNMGRTSSILVLPIFLFSYTQHIKGSEILLSIIYFIS